MFKKTRNIALVAGVLAAISFGGTALAGAGAAPAPTGKATAAKVEAGTRTALAAGFSGPDRANDVETADGGEPAGTDPADKSGEVDQADQAGEEVEETGEAGGPDKAGDREQSDAEGQTGAE